MRIKTELQNAGINTASADFEALRESAQQALGKLWLGELDFTGWVKDPHKFDDTQIRELQATADEIRSKCEVFLVLGVGGSFMGAKAVIDMLGARSDTEVLFAGYNFSGRYIQELLAEIEGRDVCLCVISKSGSTTETLSAYGIFKEWMIAKYGVEGTAERTYVVTEMRSNRLFDQATAEGCKIFDLPVDIGGRYSVLTPVGLLPIAVSGIDIGAMMRGARAIASAEAFAGDGLDYAVTRQMHYTAGKSVEVFEFFDPYFAYFGEWLKQLFGETEGKDGKGIFPASLVFSRDLHSMGQFLQQGSSCFFETFVTAEVPLADVGIPESAMEPFGGKTIEAINKCAEHGVAAAHAKAGIPLIRISLPDMSEEIVGELLYFFEVQCAVSALMMGVNPFNQPGVEDYKREMKAYIGEL